MPIWADPRRGENVRLVADDDLSLLATFVAPPAARPTAHDLAAVPEADLERLAAVCVRDLPGVRVVTKLEEAAALMDAGADVVASHAHMIRPLGDDALEPDERWVAPQLAPNISLIGPSAFPGAPAELAASLAALQQLAYGHGHPDRGRIVEAQVDGSLLRLVSGELHGEVDDDLSSLAVDDASGTLLAAVIVVDFPRLLEEWSGGPWVVELVRVPGLRGALGPSPIGRALLARAVAVAHLSGHAAIGAAVNAADPAKRMVERLGFADAFHRVTLDLPGAWPRA